jgi:hypothetical protein
MVRAVTRDTPVADDGPFRLRDRAGVIRASIPRQRGVVSPAGSVNVCPEWVSKRTFRRAATLAWTVAALLVGMWLGSGLHDSQQAGQAPAVNASGIPPIAVVPEATESTTAAPRPGSPAAPSAPAVPPTSDSAPPTVEPDGEAGGGTYEEKGEDAGEEPAAAGVVPVERETFRVESTADRDTNSIVARIDRHEPSEHMRDLRRQVRDVVEPVLIGLFGAAGR